MSQEQPTQNENLFLQLITSYSAGAWIGMGKMKNPVTNESQRNLKQAQFSIDMLEMLGARFSTNLADWEAEYLAKTLHDLKMNFIAESDKGDTAEPSAASTNNKTEDKSEDNDRG